MATIVVPTDFSENAYNALFYATQLFPKEACKIILAHSFENQFSTSTSRIDIGKNEALYDTLETTTNKQLEEVKQSIYLDCEDIALQVETFCGAQPLYKIVDHLVLKKGVHFVVMGTKGASGLKEIFLGSQAVKLIKKVKPVPVFLIPKKAKSQKPSNITYATDLKIDYATYPLEIIKKILSAHQSQLYIAHIYNQKSPGNTVEYNYRKLKQKLEDVTYSTHWISSRESMQEALAQFCTKHQINLLVLMYHKYGFLKRILKTSFIDKVSFHSEIPVLILPESF